MKTGSAWKMILLCALLAVTFWADDAFAESASVHSEFPRALESYEYVDGIWSMLKDRVSEEPFNHNSS